MRNILKTILTASLILATGSLSFCQEAEKKGAEKEKKKPSSIRFHSGTILAAELMPEGFFNPIVLNASKFEPPSRITTDVAFATITVRLDPSRTLSVYDYSLQNKKKDEFKCMGISDGDNRYEADKWEFAITKPDKLYTMLFKVQLPSFNEKNEYVLHYNLNKLKSEDVLIPFVRITRNFISPSKIPPEGIIGIDPEPPPPPEPPKPAEPEPAKAEPEKKEEKKEEKKPADTAKKEEPAKDTLPVNVPDAKKYTLIYDLDLVKSNGAIKYQVDDHSKYNKKLSRVAYYVELKGETGDLQWVFVSMNPFTDDLSKIGVPTYESKAKFQQLVEKMTVISKVKGLTNGKDLKGNIEFWPNNYREKNAKAVPNAYDGEFDAGDEMFEPEKGYGSMQIHNYNDRETIFAFNHWTEGNNADLGIGNSPEKGKPDWTFAKNAGTYAVKRIRVLVTFK
ncbi:MAG: hypothetical protein A2X48_04700 [Lentisphaerae bacterium GWF2_49_21]|nr:MAG: hypothetical protein A2X48_04700 [Lentisphaerae bacterium GWF2_49_21]